MKTPNARAGSPSLAALPALLALVASACTTFDGLTARAHELGDGDGAPEEPSCVVTSCPSGVCGPDGACAEATTTDGVKNGSETDVDCGGGGAPKCAAGKACREATDCVWGHCTAGVCEGHLPGRKDGDQTDIDCGGTMSPPCDWDKACLVDADCASAVCSAEKRCAPGPSCRATVRGGTTCGAGESDDPGKMHESCCRSLPVDGYADPRQPGKKVFLDKYEITAGRMRAFLEAIATGAQGIPDVKGYLAGHRPSRWNAGWESILPAAATSGTASYTVTSPTTDPLYPGQDRYAPTLPTGNTFYVQAGAYTVQTGLVFALGAAHLFPEFRAPVPPWPSADYAATHNLNCSNERGSYGYGTYWFDDATIAAAGGGVGKAFSKDVLDEKALSCAPFALLAAFCAWDGGQLMTTEVFDHVAGGPWPVWSLEPGATTPPPPPRLVGGPTTCAENTLNTFPDGGQSCPNVYFHPDPKGSDYDGSSRIAPPGRVPADAVALKAGDEPWMDLKGNLQEAALGSDGRFEHRGYGVAWGSIRAHLLQITLPRMKGGAFGARCMRFK